MPRTLSRLQYRKPPVPIAFHGRNGRPLAGRYLENRVTAFVNRQSNPRHVRLQVVANPKARLPATKQSVIHPIKPFTLKDIVDPDGKARHGEIIYIFRNLKTNQIIYSLTELLTDHHLAQLPFIGKHSKPPVLRPDEWTPHCVVTFPNAAQGHSAFRRLREFRKVHEYAWDKTNPEWKRIPVKSRMKKIMDQRANTAVDLARVLAQQDVRAEKMEEALRKRQEWEAIVLDEKWAEVDALVKAAAAKEKLADNVKWLEHQIRSLTLQLNMKHNQNDKDQQRLKNAKIQQEKRLHKIQWAQRKAEQLKTVQADLEKKAAPANEFGADGKLDELKTQASLLRDTVANADPIRSPKDQTMDRDLLKSHEAEIAALEEAFNAKAQLENRSHYIHRSVLPQAARKLLPMPFTLEGVRVQWADIRDALSAAEQWPELIEHEDLPLRKSLENVAFLSVEDYQLERAGEVGRILETLEAQRTDEAEMEVEAVA